MQFDTNLFVPVHASQHQLFGIAMSKERRQSDSVIGSSRLFAERDDPKAFRLIERDQVFAKAKPDHAVADDDDCLFVR